MRMDCYKAGLPLCSVLAAHPTRLLLLPWDKEQEALASWDHHISDCSDSRTLGQNKPLLQIRHPVLGVLSYQQKMDSDNNGFNRHSKPMQAAQNRKWGWSHPRASRVQWEVKFSCSPHSGGLASSFQPWLHIWVSQGDSRSDWCLGGLKPIESEPLGVGCRHQCLWGFSFSCFRGQWRLRTAALAFSGHFRG